MLSWFQIGQIVIAILLMVAILVQNRGTGVGGVFGGSGGVYLTKRGVEKKLHIATIVMAVIFVLFSLIVFRYNT